MTRKFDPTYFRDRLIVNGLNLAQFHDLLIRNGVKISREKLYKFYQGKARPRNPAELMIYMKYLGGDIRDWVKMMEDEGP